MKKINIKKLNENAMIPTRSSEHAAGYDLYACLDLEYMDIQPHETVKIGTGYLLKYQKVTLVQYLQGVDWLLKMV